jgi:uncharacterized paraquat-inducible protein A
MGTLISMAHYHSEGLECLHHANEQHYAETDPVCPVCTILVYEDTGDKLSFTHELTYQETIVAIQEILLSDEFHTPLLGRAPPSLI